jgi:NAD+ synthase
MNTIFDDNLQDIYISLVSGLREFFGKAGFKRAVLGLSGGIDSALTLKIAVDALGAENITGLIMPELGLTSRENIEHALGLAEAFGVHSFKIPINRYLQEYNTLPWVDKLDEIQSTELEAGVRIAEGNTKSRVRANILYHFANSCQALVLGTSNMSETRLGYGTKHGDLAADVEVIGALYKTQIRALAMHLGLPEVIIQKKPSAELYKDQTDEKDLGADYSELDTILHYGKAKSLEMNFDVNLVKKVFELEKNNLHKSVMPYIIPIFDEI